MIVSPNPPSIRSRSFVCRNEKEKNRRQFERASNRWPVFLGIITTLRLLSRKMNGRPRDRFIHGAPCKRHFPSEFPLANNVLIISDQTLSGPLLHPVQTFPLNSLLMSFSRCHPHPLIFDPSVTFTPLLRLSLFARMHEYP